jgi:MFS family permease
MRPRLATRGFLAALAASFGTLTSFYLLLSALPAHLLAEGADPVLPGMLTGGTMLAGVATELAAAGLIARIGAHRTFALGAAALGASALLVLVDSLGALVACCIIRGLGFGLTVVASGTILIGLVPPERRGEGVGVFGFVASAPAIAALPLGVWIVRSGGGIGVVGVAAAASALLAIVPLLGAMRGGRATAARAVPSAAPGAAAPGAEAAAGARGAAPDAVPDAPAGGIRTAARDGALVRPAVAFAATTIAAGAVVTFLPAIAAPVAAAGLLVQALTSAVTRGLAGRIGDRVGHSRLLVPSLVLIAAGLVLSVFPSAVAAIAGMAVFGIGFGATQTATFTLMAERVTESGHASISALWNLAYDLGYGIGPIGVSILALATGLPIAFALSGALVLLAVPLVVLDRQVARLRTA